MRTVFLAGMIVGVVPALAQATASPGLEGSGWVGAGILGGVLYWLMFHHLPAKDKQIKELVEGHASHIERLDKAHADDLKQTREDIKGIVATLVAHSDRSDAQIVAKLEEVRSELAASREQRQQIARERHDRQEGREPLPPSRKDTT